MQPQELSIQQQIDTKTKGVDQPLLGETKLEILLPHAVDFLKNHHGADAPITKDFLKHPFVEWINNPPHEGFLKAYKMIVTNNAITGNDLKLFFDLQFIYANAIEAIMGLRKRIGKESFNAQVAPKMPLKDALHNDLKSIQGKLNLGTGGIQSPYESQWFLLERLIKDILDSEPKGRRNLFNAAGAHSFLLREVLTKRLIQELLICYWKSNLECSFVANVALEMLSIFFNPMDKSDATDWAKEIKKAIEKDMKYCQQTIGNYIGLPF